MQTRRPKDCKSKRGWMTPKKPVFFQTQEDGCTYEVTETETEHTWPAQVQARWGPATGRVKST